MTITNTSSNTLSNGVNWDVSTTSISSIRINPTSSGTIASISPNPCNESKAHDNEEKALFHGLKSAFRMSRQFDGEYGTADPPWESAARIAGNVAVAFFETTDHEYDREESFEYLRETVVGDPNTVDRILSVFGLGETRLEDGLATNADLEAGIDRAWNQIDDKGHHADAARTALAIAEAYLGERFE